MTESHNPSRSDEEVHDAMLQDDDRVPAILLLQDPNSLKTKLETLQIRYERLNGECVDGLSIHVLESISTLLRSGLLTVNAHLTKMEAELEEAEKEHMEEYGVDEDMRPKLIRARRNRSLEYELSLSKQRKIWRNKARRLRSSTLETKQHLNREAMVHKFETLELLIRQMTGKELESLNYFETMILRREVQNGLLEVVTEHHKQRKQLEEDAKMAPIPPT